MILARGSHVVQSDVGQALRHLQARLGWTSKVTHSLGGRRCWPAVGSSVGLSTSPSICGLATCPGLLGTAAGLWKELSQSKRSKKQEAEAARAVKGCAWDRISVISVVFCWLNQSQGPPDSRVCRKNMGNQRIATALLENTVHTVWGCRVAGKQERKALFVRRAFLIM